jgi:formylglycine-generating enzyme required for sulfatase activity/energy-coupling factor transporter ATP-binding protein EcfA2
MADEADLRHQIAALEQDIAEIQAELAAAKRESVRQALNQELAEKEQERAALSEQLAPGSGNTFAQANVATATQGNVPQTSINGGVNASSASFGNDAVLAGGNVNQGTATINDGAVGVNVGVNLGRIIYGADLDDQLRKQLVRYLQRLANAKAILQLKGLATNLASGLDLPAVYVLLATEGLIKVASSDEEKFAMFFNDGALKSEYDSEVVLPDTAILEYVRVLGEHSSSEVFPLRVLYRSELVAEVVLTNQHLVLCGVPGSGKSTFLHHLAWVLAMRGLDQIDDTTYLSGWNDNGQQRMLPVMLSLRTLAGAIKREGASAATVSAVLCHELTTTYDLRQPDELLDHALSRTGKALLLFDGLDEVPLEATETSADRGTTLVAVRDFARLHAGARVVITCRVRAWTDAFAQELDWPVATIAPLRGGQMRHFVHALYPQLVSKGVITADQAAHYSDSLIAAIFDPHRPRLREMAENPLMLTMMALVRTRGELPRDRPALYEEILRQLLGQWDVQREGQSLAQVIGDERIGSDQIRTVLDRLSYEAHRDATSEDGRGRISRRDLRLALSEYFAEVKVAGAYEAAQRCIDYFDQRSGLLQPEDDGSMYAFAHLTLQEHCAGRHLLLVEGVARVMELRSNDRWREPIFLGFGVVMQAELGAPVLKELLTDLTHRCDAHGADKPVARWYRDLMLAVELGADRDWALLLEKIKAPRIQQDIRAGLVRLLEDRENNLQAEQVLLSVAPAGEHLPVTVHERIHAADLLAEIGDPRFPVTAKQWRDQPLTPTFTATGTHYWRFVPAGTYRIGGWEHVHEYADHALPAFWIARFPTTVAQYRAFIQAGGYNRKEWWTPRGWWWSRTEAERTEPDWWDVQATQESVNQPVVGVTWYEARAFCGWLDEVLARQEYTIRLPSEAEWEAAAAYAESGVRGPFPWRDAALNLERAIYNEHAMNSRPAPVGTCPLGATAGGALDMVGNVWEWTQSRWAQYPAASSTIDDDSEPSSFRNKANAMPYRGGSYSDNNTDVGCAAQVGTSPDTDFDGMGFRCVVASRSR